MPNSSGEKAKPARGRFALAEASRFMRAVGYALLSTVRLTTAVTAVGLLTLFAVHAPKPTDFYSMALMITAALALVVSVAAPYASSVGSWPYLAAVAQGAVVVGLLVLIVMGVAERMDQ